MHRFSILSMSLLGLFVLGSRSSLVLGADDQQIVDLSIEDLLNVKVTTASKKAQILSDTSAAVFVINHEDIKRSGATSIPEVLRLAPGVDVARINNRKWAVTIRGFNGSLANKLLVMIDGRSVYSPDASGVYWDAQDVMLEDVERIEVIRGPGATLWGANAVNGVINIITQHAEDTQGGLLNAGGGSQELGFGSVRYGAKLADETFARAYFKGFLRDEYTLPKNDSSQDNWQQVQGGFRVDSLISTQDTLSMQGNIYRGEMNQTLQSQAAGAPFQTPVDTSGWNLTSRLHHAFSSTADYSLQFFYNHEQRDEFVVNNRRDTVNIDFQNTFSLGNRHNVIWGLGYRYSSDHFEDVPILTIKPNSRETNLYNLFAQDDIVLIEKYLSVTLGSRLEHNDYTGFEVQPTARLLWTPKAGHKAWASISRAVRTPSRIEDNGKLNIRTLDANSTQNSLPLPLNVTLNGNPAYKAEQLLSYELGYRVAITPKASLDITAFYNDYHTLRSSNTGAPSYDNGQIEIPIVFNNRSYGHTYGVEVAQVWQMLDWWRWDLSYGFLDTKLYNIDHYQAAISPKHKVSLRASLTPINKVNLDFWLRYSDAAQAVNPLSYNALTSTINEYVTMDIRLAWQAHEKVELSITGQNLLESGHLEYIDESYALHTPIQRSVYAKVSWRF